MTTDEKDLPGELLLVAIVEMASGHAAAGQRDEDAVLELLNRHGGSVERRMFSTDAATEVHVIRFRSRVGYESFMVDTVRLGYRDRLGDAASNTLVLEVRTLDHAHLRTMRPSGHAAFDRVSPGNTRSCRIVCVGTQGTG